MKTKNNIEVSVIIPNYNYGKYIKSCITSVLESDFNHSILEIIIIDDASTDNSIQIVEQIENKTKTKIHLIKQPINLGLAKTRNTGIENAAGNYLFFLDSDNYIGKSCLKTHYDFLKENASYTACYAPIQKFDDRSNKMLTVFSNHEYDYNKLLYGNYIDAMSMIRKQDLIELGFYDDEMPYSGWEDYELWLRIGSRNKQVYFINGEPLSYYRMHEDSMIRSMQSDQISTLASYISEKYVLNTPLKINDPSHTKIQLFWAGEDVIFSEESSLFEFVQLQHIPKNVTFQLGTFAENIAYLRFDLGDEVGLINIHSLVIKDQHQNIKWFWDKKTLYAQQNLLLVENNKIWPDKILQISRSIDPAIIIATTNSIKELALSGFSIEITLSNPDSYQLDFLNKNIQPLTCFSENEFTALALLVSECNNEKDTLLSQLEIQTALVQNLQKEHKVLSENNILFQQLSKQYNDDKVSLNNDRLIWAAELNLKNDLLNKASGKIEKLEEQINEKVQKEITLINTQNNVVLEYNAKILAQKDELHKMQNEHIAAIKSLRADLENIRVKEAEERSNAVYFQQKFQSNEALSISLQKEILLEQKKSAALNNQVTITEGKLNELQVICATKEQKNIQLTNENINIEKKLSTLSDSLNENLKQKQELIASINLHLAHMDKLHEEKREMAESHTLLLEQSALIKLDKQQIEMYLSESNKKNQENELLINTLKEEILRLKDQKLITFIKEKINSKRL